MKSFLILFSLFIVGSVCRSTEDDELETNIMKLLYRLPQPIPTIIRNTVEFSGNTSADIDHMCPHSSENFTKAFKSVIECADATDKSLPVCTALKTRLITCFTPVINVTENCMREKSKGVPTLIAKFIMSAISHLCGLTGEQMFEFLNDCMMQNWNEENEHIIKELQGKLDKIRDNLSVKNICSTGPEIKNVHKEFVRTFCPNQIMTQSVHTGLVDALLKPCTDINEV